MKYGRITSNIRAAGWSDRGRVRTENQDAWRILPEASLFILADGLGGHLGGGTASQMVIDNLPSLITQEMEPRRSDSTLTEGATPAALKAAVKRLNDQVYRGGLEDLSLHGMGSTVVLALIQAGVAHVLHVGDSRAYLWRDGRLDQMTEDHTVGAVLVHLNEIEPEDIDRHPEFSRLSRFIGMEGEVEADVQELRLKSGDRLLLCSDGITNMIGEEEIAALLGAFKPARNTCKAMVAAANAAGGLDNATALLIDVATA